jgi:hypothetical protein
MAANDLASVSSMGFKNLSGKETAWRKRCSFFAVAFFEVENDQTEMFQQRWQYFGGRFQSHASAVGFGGCAVRG